MPRISYRGSLYVTAACQYGAVVLYVGDTWLGESIPEVKTSYASFSFTYIIIDVIVVVVVINTYMYTVQIYNKR